MIVEPAAPAGAGVTGWVCAPIVSVDTATHPRTAQLKRLMKNLLTAVLQDSVLEGIEFVHPGHDDDARLEAM